MHQHEPAGSSLLAQILHHATRRRYRIFTVTGIALVLLWAAWVYYGLGIDGSRARPHHWFPTNDSMKDHQTQTTAGQECSGSGWRAQNPEADVGFLIPPKIWQILLPKKQSVDNLVIAPERLRDTASWLALNTDYT
jgi:alpha 1,6-mannosyltransferase